MKYCKYCGASLEDNDKFCDNCGKQAGISEVFGLQSEPLVSSDKPNLPTVKNSSSNLYIILSSILVLIGGGVISLVLLTSHSTNSYNYPALKLLSRKKGKLYRKALISSLKRGVKKGIAGAEYLLGLAYATGYGVKEDYNKAVYLFKKAAMQNYPGGELMLGFAFVKGYGVAKNKAKAIYWFKKAAMQNYPGGELMLGIFSHTNYTNEYSNNINSEAKRNLGAIFTDETAFDATNSTFISAGYMADKGANITSPVKPHPFYYGMRYYVDTPPYHCAAMTNSKTGKLTDNGYNLFENGVIKRRVISGTSAKGGFGDLGFLPNGMLYFYYYVKALPVASTAIPAKLNAPPAFPPQSNGICGNGYEAFAVTNIGGNAQVYAVNDYSSIPVLVYGKSYKAVKPLYWVKKAAKHGSVGADVMLGVLYLFGKNGVHPDRTKAQYWFGKAGEQENPAMDLLIASVYMGKKTSAMNAAAFYWFKKAAGLNSSIGDFMVGDMYLEGKGVPKDVVKFLYWFKKAAENGSPSAEYMIGLAYYKGGSKHLGVYIRKNKIEAKYWFKKAAKKGVTNKNEALSELEKSIVHFKNNFKKILALNSFNTLLIIEH